jgi:hypothetical protein
MVLAKLYCCQGLRLDHTLLGMIAHFEERCGMQEKNKNHQTFSDKTWFLIGIIWSGFVLGAYHWHNKPYYIEKLSVFIGFLKGMIG